MVQNFVIRQFRGRRFLERWVRGLNHAVGINCRTGNRTGGSNPPLSAEGVLVVQDLFFILRGLNHRSLLNCRTGNRTGGSNPPLSAEVKAGRITESGPASVFRDGPSEFTHEGQQ